MIIYLANNDDDEMLYVFTRKYPNYNCLDRYLSVNQVDSNMDVWVVDGVCC